MPKIISRDRKSTRLNSSHTVIYTLSLHDALPILRVATRPSGTVTATGANDFSGKTIIIHAVHAQNHFTRSEEHTSELQSHSDLHSFPTRRSSDLARSNATLRNRDRDGR